MDLTTTTPPRQACEHFGVLGGQFRNIAAHVRRRTLRFEIRHSKFEIRPSFCRASERACEHPDRKWTPAPQMNLTAEITKIAERMDFYIGQRNEYRDWKFMPLPNIPLPIFRVRNSRPRIVIGKPSDSTKIFAAKERKNHMGNNVCCFFLCDL
jgi:hypothetical protein